MKHSFECLIYYFYHRSTTNLLLIDDINAIMLRVICFICVISIIMAMMMVMVKMIKARATEKVATVIGCSIIRLSRLFHLVHTLIVSDVF